MMSSEYDEYKVESPLLRGELCKLINTKQERLYVHTHDPTNVLSELRSKLDLSDEVMNRFDPERRTNCCNVIAISLYFTSCNEDTMTKYLASIARSVKNVEKYLPTWVVRVYFSTSVFSCIQRTSRTSAASIAYERIIRSDNVEIYTYECPESDIGPIEFSRTYRFLPSSEPDVNEWISMEADGTVTIWHCKLITWFSKSTAIFYMPIATNLNLFKNFDIHNVFDAYSHWLLWYKSVFRREFFKTHQTVYDILAGMIGCKLKIKREFYLEIVSSLRNEINEFRTNPESVMRRHVADDDNVTFHVRGAYYTPSMFYSMVPNIKKIVTLGFDEMVLMELFREVISTDLTKDNTFPRVIKDKKGVRISTNAIGINNNAFTSDRKVSLIENMVCAEHPAMKMLEFSCDQTHTFADAIMYFGLELIKYGAIDAVSQRPPLPPLPQLQKLCIDDDMHFRELFYAIDGILMQRVKVIERPFDLIVTFNNNRRSISELINVPYSNSYDVYYGDEAAAAGAGGSSRRHRKSISGRRGHQRKNRSKSKSKSKSKSNRRRKPRR